MSGQILVVDDSATVRKIVRLVLEEAGYGVADAADGQQALDLVQREMFDLALIDFVMPKLNGYQLTQAIRSIPHLRKLPIVLMSAKAEQIGERFMRQTGAVDAITKPFPPDAILAVVSHAVSMSQPPPPPTLVGGDLRGASLMPPPMDGFHEAPARSDAPASQPDFAGTIQVNAPPPGLSDDKGIHAKVTSPDVGGLVSRMAAQTAASQKFAEMVARVALPIVEQVSRDEAQLTERALVDAITRSMTSQDLAALARELKSYDEDLRGPIAIEGAIALAPLGELLQMLRLQRQTGTLVVQRKISEVALAFDKGNIDVAVARGVSSEFLLGRYLVAADRLSREELEEFLRNSTEQSGWLGERLVRSGRISPEHLQQALQRQTSEIIYEMLRWPDGTYRFEQNVVLPEAQSAQLGLPVESIVLEGFRRVDEWRVIEQEVTSFDEVLARNEAAIESVGLDRLAREEQVVIGVLDGMRTVRDVVHASKMSSFDTCRILYRLLRAKLIRRRGA